MTCCLSFGLFELRRVHGCLRVQVYMFVIAFSTSCVHVYTVHRKTTLCVSCRSDSGSVKP